jgi:hypothetical protein
MKKLIAEMGQEEAFMTTPCMHVSHRINHRIAIIDHQASRLLQIARTHEKSPSNDAPPGTF